MVTVTSSASSVNSSFDRLRVSEYMARLGLATAALRFRDCGEEGRGWVGLCPSGHYVYHAFGCELRICPVCGGRRSRAMEEKLVPALLEQMSVAPSGYRLVHVVLGSYANILDYLRLSRGGIVRSGLLSLKAVVVLLRGCVVDLFRGYQDDGDVLGFAVGCEFGARAGTLHFHILALAKFIPQVEMSRDWAAVNVGHGSYCSIEAVDSKPAAVRRAVGYLCKYVTKPLFKGIRDGDDQTTVNVARMTDFVSKNGIEPIVAAMAFIFHGLRRFQTYAGFYDLEFPPDEPECCPECGGGLIWRSELEDALARAALDLVNTFSTDKLHGDRASPDVQLRLNWG